MPCEGLKDQIRHSYGFPEENLNSRLNTAMAYNGGAVYDVAPRPKGPRGHVAERRAAAPRSPRHPEGVPMHIRAVMRNLRE